MGGGEEIEVLNRLVGTVHMRREHLSSNLKEVREWARHITLEASYLDCGIVRAKALNCSSYSENSKGAAMASVEQAKKIMYRAIWIFVCFYIFSKLKAHY